MDFPCLKIFVPLEDVEGEGGKTHFISAYLEERLLGKGGEEACSLAVTAWSKQEPRNESETHGGGDGVRQKWG